MSEQVAEKPGQDWRATSTNQPGGESRRKEPTMQWTWNDGLEYRSRKPACIVVTPNGDCHRFQGATIPNVAEVVNEKFEQNGKWSNTTYTVLSPDGTTPVAWHQSWEEGRYWPQAFWREAIAWLRERAPQASAQQAEELIRREWPKVAAKFDSATDAEARMGAPVREIVIVTRHAGMVEWLAQHGYTGTVLAQVKRSDVEGKIVVGVLPLHLAALTAEIVTVDMPELKPEQRGQDLTPAEMDAAGATISRYVVHQVTK